MTPGATAQGGRWFVPPPDPEGPLLFCFPYAGVGASSYRQWPRRVGGFQVCALQPPGRENRMREPAHRSHAAFAADLVDALAPHTGREYAFAGHCGAVPYALETIFELAARELPLPSRLVASSWGAPHRGLYGALNFVDLSSVDLVDEVMALFGRGGAPMRRDFAEIAAGVLQTDLQVQRGYRLDPGRRVPCPVTVVAWTDDDVVPPDQVHPGWPECADVTEELLTGRHLDFLQCPDVLRDAMHRWLSAPSPDGGHPGPGPVRASGEAVTVPGDAARSARPHTIHAAVAEWARRAPDAPAVTGAGTTVTYGELVARADRVAAALVERGIGPEDRVAVALPRGPDMVVAFLAVLRAGGTYVPLDPQYPPHRRAFIVEDTGVALLVTDGEGAADAVEHAVTLADLGGPSHGRPEAPAAAVGPANAAYIVFTSGSTGRPKGVVVDHAAVVGLVEDEPRIAVQPGDTVAHLAPAAFDASVFEIWGALCRGGHVVVLDARTTVAELGAQLRRCAPDWLFLTTGLFHLLAQHDPAALDSVGCLLTGGDVLSPRLVQAAARTRCRVYAAYGPTETTVFASLQAITAAADDDAALAPVPIGSALAAKAMYVLGPDLQPLPPGRVGEIYVGGAGVARGYHRRAGLTAEHFLPDPFTAVAGSRMYRTGDRGCRAVDGTVDFHGRIDRQVKVRGFRVELGEIENALLAHRDVGGAVVVAIGEPGAEKRLVAYVVPGAERALTVAALRDWLGERVPAYMVPATIDVLDAIPLDPNGKPDRHRLPDPFLARAGLTFLPSFEPATTEVQQILVDAWADVLGLDVVGIDDDFFLLGGDSLRSVSMLERLRRYGIDVEAGQFFANPTVRELAAVIDAELVTSRA